MPSYHVMSRYGDWCGRDGAWLTEVELRRHVAACCERARSAQVDDLPACEAAATGVPALLAAAQQEAKMLLLTLYMAVHDNERVVDPGERNQNALYPLTPILTLSFFPRREGLVELKGVYSRNT